MVSLHREGAPLSTERKPGVGGAPQGVGTRVLALLVISSHDPDLPGLDFLTCEMRAWDSSVLLRGRGHDPDLGKETVWGSDTMVHVVSRSCTAKLTGDFHVPSNFKTIATLSLFQFRDISFSASLL